MAASERDAGILEKTRPATKRPQVYRVILLNDDYTTMQFVVEILESVFAKSPAEAHRIMMEVHNSGRGVCGAYPYEIAETKVDAVHEKAKEHGFPLRASLEEE
jgi:ATP-dependent Clp protease adaptor protein ClpS